MFCPICRGTGYVTVTIAVVHDGGYLPDYIVVEGPLAGGHLGFGMDWAQYDLATIVAEVIAYLKEAQLDIPVIPAGGIFTGSDAAAFLENGAAAVQVATRFTVARECGLPADGWRRWERSGRQPRDYAAVCTAIASRTKCDVAWLAGLAPRDAASGVNHAA